MSNWHRHYFFSSNAHKSHKKEKLLTQILFAQSDQKRKKPTNYASPAAATYYINMATQSHLQYQCSMKKYTSTVQSHKRAKVPDTCALTSKTFTLALQWSTSNTCKYIANLSIKRPSTNKRTKYTLTTKGLHK